MNNNMLKVTIPFDENFEKVKDHTSRMSYKKEFWHSFVPPHKVVYEFGPLSDVGVDNVKDAFREMFKESKYKGSCNFEVEEIE